jgi:hypothetical protein
MRRRFVDTPYDGMPLQALIKGKCWQKNGLAHAGWAHLAKVRQQGFAFTDNLVADGVGGVGMNVEVTTGTYAAITAGAIRARMQDERRAGIARLMREELDASGFAR